MKKNTGQLCIITINYNNREGLIETFDSIRRQTCKDFEYIVVDGGSTDGSVEVIQSNADIVDQWVSEPDAGIYNAMNKGVKMYGGDGYVIFMNSGDIFYSDQVIEKFIGGAPSADIICGGWVGYDGSEKKMTVCAPRSVSMYHFIMSTLPHNSSFVKARVLRQIPFREDFRIVSDWVFFWEAILDHKHSYARLNYHVCKGDMGGISNTQFDLLEAERAKYIDSIPTSKLCRTISTDLYYVHYNVYNQVNNDSLYKGIVCMYKVVHRVCLWLMSFGNK